MKPFNFKKALQGQPLCTSDGCRVTSFKYYPDAVMCPISITIEGSEEVIAIYTDGKSNCVRDIQLRMADRSDLSARKAIKKLKKLGYSPEAVYQALLALDKITHQDAQEGA